MISEPWMLCSQPLPTPPSCRPPQYSAWDEKAVDLFNSIMHGQRSLALTSLACSHFPPWENLQAGSGGVSWHWTDCLGEGVMQVEWNGCSYPLQCIQCQIFFKIYFCDVLEIRWTPWLTQLLSSVSDSQNWCSLEGRQWKLFTILLISLLGFA